jgi:hypothetical protein
MVLFLKQEQEQECVNYRIPRFWPAVSWGDQPNKSLAVGFQDRSGLRRFLGDLGLLPFLLRTLWWVDVKLAQWYLTVVVAWIWGRSVKGQEAL